MYYYADYRVCIVYLNNRLGLTYRYDTGIRRVVRLNEPHSPYVQPVTLQVAQPSRSKGPVSDR